MKFGGIIFYKIIKNINLDFGCYHIPNGAFCIFSEKSGENLNIFLKDFDNFFFYWGSNF